MTDPWDSRTLVPPLPPMHIRRPRLLSALDNARDLPITLLSAPPGAGKTVLLSDWARGLDGPVAWITATPHENEPRRFWQFLFSAIRANGGDLDELRRVLPEVDDAIRFESPSGRASAGDRLALVVDDAHVLTHPAVLRGLDSVVCGWNPRLQLVLAARSDPLLPLHRYRLAGQMRELRAVDLAMTDPEAHALLSAHGVTLPDAAFDLLTARTEGWTAGVRLSAIRMAGTARPADFVDEFAVDEGSIGEYLMHEVLSRQPEPTRRLLVQTAFLGEVSGPLADAVTGIGGCAQILVNLARSNSFVTPLDPAQTRFRYHQLFAEILRHLMQQQAPHLMPTLYSRASSWYRNSGQLGEALKWAAVADDRPQVVSLLARGALAGMYVRPGDTPDPGLRDVLQRACVEGPGEPSPEERAARFAIRAISATADAAVELLTDTATAPRFQDAELRATADLAELMLAEKAGDARAADAAAQRLLDSGPQLFTTPVPGLRARLLLARARTQFLDGHYGTAEMLLQAALSAAGPDGARGVQLDALGLRALLDTHLCRYGQSEASIRDAEELLQTDTNLHAPATLDLAAALRAFVAGDFTVMAGAVDRAGDSDTSDWDTSVVMLLHLARAALFIGCGQQVEARAALQHLSRLGADAPRLLTVYRDCMLAGIDIALGRPREALHRLQHYRGTRFAVPLALPCARAHLALGDLHNAQQSVRTVLTGATAQVGRCLLIEAMLCDAEIAQRRNDDSRAVEMLTRAVEVADPNIVLPFARTADVFAPLLRRHPMLTAKWPAAPAYELTTTPETSTAAARAPHEPLSDRERAVLRLLATSMSATEIADELCVSVNTVKTHQAAIYRKLAARRRREAVLRAREFELL